MKSEAEMMSARPAGHQYPSHVMLLGIKQITYGLSSLRGSERIFEVFSKYFNVPRPSFNSMRSWVYRLGLYLINRKQEWREDRIFIIDHTVKLGQKKCLLILGITAEQLQGGQYALGHTDVSVLGMEVVTRSTGEIVKEQLEKIGQRVGTPKQIVADHGSDIKKGVELYQEEHSDVVYTYDVTHKMAALLKEELQADERWLSFAQQCGQARTSLKQTNLHFLLPPRQRTKARYSNVAPRIEWGQKIIAYQQQGDYSQIDPTFTLDQQTIAAVEAAFGPATARSLTLSTSTAAPTYANQDTFSQSLSALIGDQQFEVLKAVLYPAADKGGRQFELKLGWVAEYQEELALYAQMNRLVTMAEKQVKQQGLNQATHQVFDNHIADLSLAPRAQSLAQKISHYLRVEGQQIPTGQTLLGTSDSIESVFGKYKYLSAEGPLRDMGKMILTIPVFTTELTCELIKTAMESVSALDVDRWADELLGKSSLSQRRLLSCALETT